MKHKAATKRWIEKVLKEGVLMGSYEPVRIGITGGIRTFNLNQPLIGNPLNQKTCEIMKSNIDKQHWNRNSQLIFFNSSSPEIFSRGIDHFSFENYEAVNRVARAILRMSKYKKSTIAVYDGVVENAGYSTFADCTYRLASHSTEFSLTGLSRGILPVGARLSGRFRDAYLVRYLAISEHKLGAEDLYELGLVDFVTGACPQEEIISAMDKSYPEASDLFMNPYRKRNNANLMKAHKLESYRIFAAGVDGIDGTEEGSGDDAFPDKVHSPSYKQVEVDPNLLQDYCKEMSALGIYDENDDELDDELDGEPDEESGEFNEFEEYDGEGNEESNEFEEYDGEGNEESNEFEEYDGEGDEESNEFNELEESDHHLDEGSDTFNDGFDEFAGESDEEFNRLNESEEHEGEADEESNELEDHYGEAEESNEREKHDGEGVEESNEFNELEESDHHLDEGSNAFNEGFAEFAGESDEESNRLDESEEYDSEADEESNEFNESDEFNLPLDDPNENDLLVDALYDGRDGRREPLRMIEILDLAGYGALDEDDLPDFELLGINEHSFNDYSPYEHDLDENYENGNDLWDDQHYEQEGWPEVSAMDPEETEDTVLNNENDEDEEFEDDHDEELERTFLTRRELEGIGKRFNYSLHPAYDKPQSVLVDNRALELLLNFMHADDYDIFQGKPLKFERSAFSERDEQFNPVRLSQVEEELEYIKSAKYPQKVLSYQELPITDLNLVIELCFNTNNVKETKKRLERIASDQDHPYRQWATDTLEKMLKIHPRRLELLYELVDDRLSGNDLHEKIVEKRRQVFQN